MHYFHHKSIYNPNPIIINSLVLINKHKAKKHSFYKQKQVQTKKKQNIFQQIQPMPPKSDTATQSHIWQSNSVLKQKRQPPNQQNYMPFLFRSKRQFSLSKQQQETPAVGSYQIPSVFSESVGERQQPEFMKRQVQQQRQMTIFKSNQQRFASSKNHVPGPASYNYTNTTDSKTKHLKITHLPIQSKPLQLITQLKRSPSCPTIPDSKVKFGYVRDKQGNYKLIEKSQSQIEKQKLKLKQYLTTLEGENQFQKRLEHSFQPYMSMQNKRQQAILNNLQRFVERRGTASSSQLMSTDQQKRDVVKLVKPRVILSHGVNVEKQSQDHLGPGCYNVNLDTLKKAKKNENFQFFSSSEIRFPPTVKQSPLNPYEYIFKENRNSNLNEKTQGKLYKKSFPTNPIDPPEKQQLPGPGYYDPLVQRVKKSKGNIRFGNEQRFKESMSEIDEQGSQHGYQQRDSRILWGSLRKDKIKSPHKEFSPVSQSEIYGIMNEEPSQIGSSSKLKLNTKRNKQSAVFLDKSQRLTIANKTYNESPINPNQPKIWQKKGSFMSKLPKKYLQLKQDTPGPGAYQKLSLQKKSFNIKNQ